MATAKKEMKFAKSDFLISAKFKSRRDLIGALLENDKEYTVAEVEKAINDYMGGK